MSNRTKQVTLENDLLTQRDLQMNLGNNVGDVWKQQSCILQSVYEQRSTNLKFKGG